MLEIIITMTDQTQNDQPANTENEDNIGNYDTQGDAKQKKIGGPGFPPEGKRFSKENPPDPAKMSLGWKKRKFTRDLIRTMLNEPLRVKKDSELGKKMYELYGDLAFEMPVGELMTIRQMEKAIANQDTQAFTAVTDQGMGRPVQAIAQTNQAGDDLPPIAVMLPAGMTLGLPSNTEGADKKEEPAQ